MKTCVTCVLVSVLVSGFSCSEFRMERGLRQECPLSPLLFNLVVETFSILLNQFEENWWLKRILI